MGINDSHLRNMLYRKEPTKWALSLIERKWQPVSDTLGPKLYQNSDTLGPERHPNSDTRCV